MAENNKNKWFRFNLAMIVCISGGLLITGYSLPMRALDIAENSGKLLIAKTPDERQPEAVEQAIQQIPTSPPPAIPQPQPKQSIDSPIPVRESSNSTGSNSYPQPRQTDSTPAANPTPQAGQTNSRPSATPASNPTPQPRQTDSTPVTPASNPTRQPRQTDSTPATPAANPTRQPRQTDSTPATPAANPTRQRRQTDSTPATPAANPTRQPRQTNSGQPQRGRQSIANPARVRNSTSNTSPVAFSKLPFREINFVDFAFGVLSKGDFQSQGRYFHFYKFEGRENQLVQIRLGGSTDVRRSGNLSLNPYMFLLDPDNKVIFKRGNSGTNGGVKDAFAFVRLPVEGNYTIVVTSRNPGDTGRYSLALRNDRASYILDKSGELNAQSSTLKQNRSPYNVSQFQGKKNQLVSIRVDSINEEFSPYIVLINSQGKTIAANNDKDGVYSTLIDRARLPEDDTYYIVVTSNNPTNRGTYRLTLF